VRRPRDLVRAHALSLSLALGGAAILLVALGYASRQVAAPPKPRGPVVDTEANCETVRARYVAELTRHRACTRDEECIAEQRGGVRSALDGCARFRRADAPLGDVVDPLEKAWLDRGCAQRFMTCSVPRRAQCAAGKCAELPPPPVPREWRRMEHVSWTGPSFSFFVPPDLVREKVIGEDSEVGAFTGPRYELEYDYGDYSNTLLPDPGGGDKGLHDEAVTIDGLRANLRTLRLESGAILSGVYFEETPAAKPTKPRLVLYARCKTAKDCEDAFTIARSLEFH